MKTVNELNQIWHQTENGVTKIGFTKSFLDSLDQCWHILPANMRQFKRKAPLFIVETNDALISIASPVDGSLLEHNNDAIDFPDQLTEDQVIMTVSDRTPRALVEEALNVARAAEPARPRIQAALRQRAALDELRAFAQQQVQVANFGGHDAAGVNGIVGGGGGVQQAVPVPPMDWGINLINRADDLEQF